MVSKILSRNPLFWQQHFNFAGLLPLVRLTTNVFLKGEFFSWQNLGLICASGLLYKISSSISLASKVEHFKKELIEAGSEGIEKNLQEYKEKCQSLSREYNEKQNSPYVRKVLQKMIELLRDDPIERSFHLGMLKKISHSNQERDERIVEGAKPRLDHPKSLLTAEERVELKLFRTNWKTNLEKYRKPTPAEKFLKFFSSAIDVMISFATDLTGVREPKVFNANPQCVQGKEADSWRRILQQQTDVTSASMPETGNLDGFSYAVATHAGYKKGKWVDDKQNEDRWIAESFVARVSKQSKKEYLVRVFGVADGHLGDYAADYSRIHFSRHLKAHLENLNTEIITPIDINNALIKTFASLNQSFYESNAEEGTTLTVSVIIDDMLFTAWVGDSRALLMKNDPDPVARLIPLTKDHKPQNQEASIKARGGLIVNEYGIRVGRMYTDPETNVTKPRGELTPGRVLGDCYMKRGISSRPSITMRPLSTIPEGSLLVLGTDGVFGNGSSRGYSDGIYECITNSLMDLSFQIVGSAVLAQWQGLRKKYVDNTTALVVRVPEYRRG